MKRNGSSSAVRKLGTTIVLIAVAIPVGCATTFTTAHSPDPIAARAELESQRIDESENQCVTEAAKSNDHRIAAADPFHDPQTQRAKELNSRVLECKAIADREREDLSARERADYQEEAQRERDHISLVMILTAGSPH